MLASLKGCKVPVGIQKTLINIANWHTNRLRNPTITSLRRSINIKWHFEERIIVGKKILAGIYHNKIRIEEDTPL